jgi:hypothetical protein
MLRVVAVGVGYVQTVAKQLVSVDDVFILLVVSVLIS